MLPAVRVPELTAILEGEVFTSLMETLRNVGVRQVTALLNRKRSSPAVAVGT